VVAVGIDLRRQSGVGGSCDRGLIHDPGDVPFVEIRPAVEVEALRVKPRERKIHRRNVGDLNLPDRHQTAAPQSGIKAARPLGAMGDPLLEIQQYRALSRDKWIAVNRELAINWWLGLHRGWLCKRIAAAVLRAGEMVNSDIGWNFEISPASRIGRVQGHQGLPILGIGYCSGDLRASIRLATAIELTGGDSRKRVERIVPGLRGFLTRKLLFRVLGP